MTPQSPVVDGHERFEVRFGTSQPEYIPLAGLRVRANERCYVVSRWLPSAEDLAALLNGGSIFLWQETDGLNGGIQPVAMSTESPL